MLTLLFFFYRKRLMLLLESDLVCLYQLLLTIYIFPTHTHQKKKKKKLSTLNINLLAIQLYQACKNESNTNNFNFQEESNANMLNCYVIYVSLPLHLLLNTCTYQKRISNYLLHMGRLRPLSCHFKCSQAPYNSYGMF